MKIKNLHFPKKVSRQNGNRYKNEAKPKEGASKDIVGHADHIFSHWEDGPNVRINRKKDKPREDAAPNRHMRKLKTKIILETTLYHKQDRVAAMQKIQSKSQKTCD